MVCVCLIDDFCLCACGFRRQGPPSAEETGRGDRERGRGAFSPSQQLPTAFAGCWVTDAWCCRGRGRAEWSWAWDGEPGKGGGPWRKCGSHVQGKPGTRRARAPWGSPQAPSSSGDTSAPTTASLAALREWGGGSKIREKQFDVSNKASLHFAKLILTPIIICCRSGLVLPAAA